MENIKDILACGFDPNKTFVFRNSDFVGTMYKNIARFLKHLTYN